MDADVRHESRAWPPSRTIPALAVGWVVLGAVAGVLEGVATAGDARFRFGPGLFLAGFLWVPITVAAVALARRVRWGAVPRWRFAAVHGAAAVAAGFVLNGLFFLVAVALGWEAPETAVRGAIVSSIRWLHLNAGGYLAVVLAVHWLERPSGPDAPRPAPEPVLFVARGQGGLQVPLSEIRWLEADGDYVQVHTPERSHLVSRRMKELEEELAGAPGMVRVHRSAMVNVAAVREVRHRSHGDFEAVLDDGTVVRVSRTRRQALLDALGPS